MAPMFEKTLDTGNGEIRISTRFVGAEEQVLLTLSGKSGTYIVDSSALLSDAAVSDLIGALQDALAKRRSVNHAETK
jgi:hypothetical protein